MTTLRKRIDKVTEKLLEQLPTVPVDDNEAAERTRFLMAGLTLDQKRQVVSALRRSEAKGAEVPARYLDHPLTQETVRAINERLQQWPPTPVKPVYGLKEAPA